MDALAIVLRRSLNDLLANAVPSASPSAYPLFLAALERFLRTLGKEYPQHRNPRRYTEVQGATSFAWSAA